MLMLVLSLPMLVLSLQPAALLSLVLCCVVVVSVGVVVVVLSCVTALVSVAPGRWPMVLSVGTPWVVSAATAVLSLTGAAPVSSSERLWQAASDAAAASIKRYRILCSSSQGPCPPEGLSRCCPCAAGLKQRVAVFGTASRQCTPT